MNDEEPQGFLESYGRVLRESPRWDPHLNLDEFRRVFGQYFPRLADDERAAGVEFGWLHLNFQPIEEFAVRRAQVRENLANFKAAIVAIAAAELPEPELTDFHTGHFLAAAYQGDVSLLDHDQQVRVGEVRIINMVSELQTLSECGVLNRALETLCGRMWRIIDEKHEIGNTKWDSIYAVDRLRILWRRNTDREAPSGGKTGNLNPATKFARFLEDGFKYLGVKGLKGTNANPASAFEAWHMRREDLRKPLTFDTK